MRSHVTRRSCMTSSRRDARLRSARGGLHRAGCLFPRAAQHEVAIEPDDEGNRDLLETHIGRERGIALERGERRVCLRRRVRELPQLTDESLKLAHAIT